MWNLARRSLRRARSLARRAIEASLERRYGLDTADHVYLEDFGLETEERVWQDPSNWVALRRALARLAPSGADVFVDYGSGLGRALVVASGFPFRRVIGVEISEAMNERARANIARVASRARAGSVEVVTADALEFDPPADLTVAYFYCPFVGDVFDRVVQRLLRSLDAHPRPLRLVYNYPLEHVRLLRTGRVRVIDVVPGTWPARGDEPGNVIVTYLVCPADRRLAASYEALFPPRVPRSRSAWLGEYEPGYVLEKPERLGGVVLRREESAPEGDRPG